MISHKRILKVIAKKYGQDPDEVLVSLWDIEGVRFDYLKNENSVVRQKDLALVKLVIDSKLKKEDIIKEEAVGGEPVKLVYLDYDFSSIGKIVSIILHITKEEILRIHEELVNDFKDLDDPIYPSGIKNEHLLDSALFHPQTSYLGKIKYPTAESAGAALMYSISSNHAFHNGNKRTAMVALLVFLDKHNLFLSCDDDALFKLSTDVAGHRLVAPKYPKGDPEIYELARWIHSNSRLMKKGERPITLKKFKQILSYFGCKILDNGKVERVVHPPFLWFKRKKILSSRKHIADTISDGDEVDKSLIKSIREDLELDHAHGIDTEAFYTRAKFTSSEFITKYKNLLKRLSKI